MTAEDKSGLLAQVGEMAACKETQGGLKVFSYAYKDFARAELDEQLASLQRMGIPAEESEDFRAVLEQDLVYLATFGLEDPLHDDIRKAVEYIAYGHPDNKDKIQAQSTAKKNVCIRMISGDHIETAKAVAYASGILDSNDG